MRVAFLVAGTQKGGTSALDAYLRRHPDLCLPRPRRGRRLGPFPVLGYPNEPHFFDTDGFFAGGRIDDGHYHALFAPGPGQLCGECTPMYMYWRDAPQRMARYNPALKVIVLLRDPVARAYSHWQMMCRLGFESLAFEDAIAAEPRRCREVAPLQHRLHAYLDRGRYLEQLERLWCCFAASQVLVLRSEALAAQPEATLAPVWRFLGVAPLAEVAPRRVNVGGYGEPIAAPVQARLRDLYRAEVRALERTLGWAPATWWA